MDEKIAKRLAEIRQREAALDRQEREAADNGDPPPVRERGYVQSFLFVVALLALAGGLLGVSVTLSRFAGEDMGDARREGQATVSSCIRQGPVTNKGFGYWESCEVEIAWDGGGVDRLTIGAIFTSADIGKKVTVGDLGMHRSRQQLAREDASYRPWLRWIGYGVGAIALVPGFIGLMLAPGLFRSRKR